MAPTIPISSTSDSDSSAPVVYGAVRVVASPASDAQTSVGEYPGDQVSNVSGNRERGGFHNRMTASKTKSQRPWNFSLDQFQGRNIYRTALLNFLAQRTYMVPPVI